jgi:hypothetical protein
MKTFVATAALATLGQAAINSDFMQGFQTGAFITSERDFEDYSCPEPEPSDKINQYLGMYNMAKNMMGGMNNNKKKGSKSAPVEEEDNLFDKIDDYIDQISVLVSIFSPDYDGGDFCAGLTAGYEGRSVAQGMFMNMLQNNFKKN